MITPLTKIGMLLTCAASLAAQPIVVGTGNPDIDVPAVQAAVDQGGPVVLMGHFSFDRPPVTPSGGTFARMVTVSKAVTISGYEDASGNMTSIDGGYRPFWVEAPGAPVTIQNLRFVRTKRNAIVAVALSGLTILDCRIEGVEAVSEPTNPSADPLADAIFVGTTYPGTPTLAKLGHPENVSGNLLIVNNDIDLQGIANTVALGIIVPAVGKSPDHEADLFIYRNSIRNTTERSIDVYLNDGQAYIEENVINTGAIMRPGGGVTPLIDAIHALRSGSYWIANNTINSAWPNGAGIRLGENGGTGAMIIRATVVGNDITMSAPDGTVFGNGSAGIEVRGYAQDNVVLNNTIRGRARAGLSAVASGTAFPDASAFISNNLDGFNGSFADVSVGAGVTNTLLAGNVLAAPPAKISDQGIGTVQVPLSVFAPVLYELGPGVVAAQDPNFTAIGAGNPAKPGQVITIYAGGLGPVMPRRGLSITSAFPTAAIGGFPCQVVFSGLAPGYPSLYQINLVVPDGLGPGNFPISISIAGQSSNVSGIVVQLGSSPVVSGGVNAASNLSGAIAPGELVVFTGSGLGPAQLVSATPDGAGLYAAQLAATSVLVNGMPAPLIYTSATQVAAIVPDSVSLGMAQVTLAYQGHYTSFPVPVVPSAPGIFTVDSTGQGHAATINQDSSINAPVNWGDVITLFVTGTGHATSGVINFYPGSPLQIVTPISIGDPQGGVAGVTQIKVPIPGSLDCDVPATIQVGNASSQAGVTIAMGICI